MPTFDRNLCKIHKIYCGNGPLSDDYSRYGTAHECMKKGFGAATWAAKKSTLPKTSLQQIKYVGPKFEENFRKKHINTLNSLINILSEKTALEKKKLLKTVFTRANGTIDYRGYNSVLLYLNDNGVNRLPKCVEVYE
jgi:hypothetical protein